MLSLARRALPSSGLRSWRRAIFGIGAMITLAIWAGVAVSIVAARHAAVEAGRIEARNLMIAFRDEVDQLLRGVDDEMTLIAERMRRERDSFDLYQWGKQNIQVSPGTIAAIVGPDGHLRSSTLAPGPPALDLSDRDNVRVHLDGRSHDLFIDRTLRLRGPGTLVVPMSRRIEAEDGTFLGVLVVMVPPGSLTRLHQSIDLGPHGIMALVGLDRVIRVRFGTDSPDGTAAIGTMLPPAAKITESDEGWIIPRRSVVDGVRRIYQFGRVPGYPLVVFVGLDLDHELAATNAQTAGIIILAAVATALLIGLGTYLIRAARLRDAHEASLMSERRKLEHTNVALTLSRDQAEAASRAKSLFLANMSHELRTPLNAVIGYAQMIRDQVLGPDAGPRYREYADDIVASGEHLLGVIGEILDTAKIEAGKFELEPENIPISDLIARSVAQLRPAMERKQIQLRVDIPDGLPILYVDANRLTQVLTNLLSNAFKFTPEHGTVRIAAECNGAGDLICTIVDTGIGMSHDEMTIALEPFTQIENSLTKKHQGTGLGLPLAKRLVELHGGELQIDSAKGRGTTVRVRLPARSRPREAITSGSIPSLGT